MRWLIDSIPMLSRLHMAVLQLAVPRLVPRPAPRAQGWPRALALTLSAACTVLFLALVLAACTAERPSDSIVNGPGRIVVIHAAAYQGFLVPSPLLPYRAEGAVQISYRGGQESGDMSLQASGGFAYRLELRARLTGSLVLDIRFDPARLLLVDYVNKSYVRTANTSAARLRLFDFDLSPDEFQILLTGRVTQARFAAGAGTLRTVADPPGGSEAVFHDGRARHRFRLMSNGLPSQWVKERDGQPLFRVEFRDYLLVSDLGGAPLHLPRKVRLFQGAAPAVLTLGVREFRVGVDGAVATDALPSAATAFRAGLLPD